MVNDWRGNTVVYTAVAGDFEHLGKHNFEDGVDYRFFTTGHQLAEGWEIEHLPKSNLDNRRLSKLPKHVPWFFDSMLNYKYAVWIDGDMQIVHNHFVANIMQYMEGGLLLSPHFDGRKCAYGEATIRPQKYQNEPMDAQVQHYLNDGFPYDYGLYETGVLVWNMKDKETKSLGNYWYLNNLVWSYQDQVSLPYAMWKLNFRPTVLPKTFRDLGYVHINAHKNEM
jgi:hypothetical protein